MLSTAINMELVIEFPIEDRSKLDILEKEFRARSRNQVWAGQAGAIDVVHPERPQRRSLPPGRTWRA